MPALRRTVLALALAYGNSAAAAELVQVTATRVPEPVATLPASVTIVTGQALRDRQAHDLSSALALVAGVQAPAGGDSGPASATPALLGLHEFDAFLLVVDGVPQGGAFNPAIATLDLNDVERVEVLKGAAPVAYGATAFVGVIQVLHDPAGKAENRVQLGYGSHGQAEGLLSVVLPPAGGWAQSLTLDGSTQGFADPREAIASGKLLYRGAGNVAGGKLRLDLDVDVARATPPSPVVRVGAALTTRTPLDANFNPRDARIDENRYQAVLGYTHATALGNWDSTVSAAFSEVSDIRGFLRPSLIDDGRPNADSQRQARRIEDIYADSHLNRDLGHGLNLLYGADALYGLGQQSSQNGAYYAPLNGASPLPATSSLHVDEVNSLSDRRLFAGQYLQLDWHVGPTVDLLAGGRLNETMERKRSSHRDGFDPTADLAGVASRQTLRPSGVLGASVAVLNTAANRVELHADARDAFKPASLDFGPDYTPNVLQPETARGREAGLKANLLHGAVELDAEAFRIDFRNLVVAVTDASGAHILQNAGGQILQGVEMGLGLHPARDWTLSLNGSVHDAHFTRYTASVDGRTIDVAGNQLPLSPRLLGSAGVLYAPRTGFYGSFIVSYSGRRFLDLANTAPMPGYTTFDASAGVRIGRADLLVTGTNLGNARPPVTASEFGTDSYYLLNGRSVLVTLAAHI